MKGDTIAGVKPLTIVQDGHITIAGLEERIRQTQQEHAETLQKYHDVWYNAPFTWPYTHFLGVGLMKSPNDLWMYQSIMTHLRPTTIIETGTYQGGSALWFAFLMDMMRIEGGRVFTVDFEDHRANPLVMHPRITYLAGNSIDLALVGAIKANMVAGPLLVCLDSDHSSEHVHAELELYAPLCKVGDWLVVEDTNIGWTDNIEHRPRGHSMCSCGSKWSLLQAKCPADRSNRGARGGLQDYLELHPNEWRQDVLSERYLLSMNPGGWLQRVGEVACG